MLELVIAVAVGFVLWSLRSAFYGTSDVWLDKVDLVVANNKIELQDDIKETHDRVVKKRKSQDDRWFSVKDIEDLMK